MKRLCASGALVLLLTLFAGCETYDSGYGGTSVSVGYYHGSGWYDPYYRRRCCYYNRPPPPPNYRPPGHRPPGHRPPGGPVARPLPSVPRQPRPALRR
jgi:hypothetical protein